MPPCSPPTSPPSAAPLAGSRQLLLVLAADWNSAAGELRRFAREACGEAWRPLGPALAVSLGRAGLAWGRGRQPALAGPAKREGDGRAPAGVFPLSALFGYDGPGSALARTAKLPYLVATRDLKCIDDPGSAHYNQIVDQAALARADWASCEEMLRDDGRYEVGAVVGHNCAPAQAGAGSCIFLHVRAAAGAPTAGCTALALADMRMIAGWLDGAAAPLLVQLPQAEYERWREAWGLPAVDG